MQLLSLAWLLDLNERVNDLVWGPPFMALLVGAGLYLTIRLRGFQFTHLGFAWRHSFGQVLRRKETDEAGAIPSFQAVAAAMAATIGVGKLRSASLRDGCRETRALHKCACGSRVRSRQCHPRR